MYLTFALYLMVYSYSNGKVRVAVCFWYLWEKFQWAVTLPASPPLASVITLASELQNERALLCSAESSEWAWSSEEDLHCKKIWKLFISLPWDKWISDDYKFELVDPLECVHPIVLKDNMKSKFLIIVLGLIVHIFDVTDAAFVGKIILKSKWNYIFYLYFLSETW